MIKNSHQTPFPSSKTASEIIRSGLKVWDSHRYDGGSSVEYEGTSSSGITIISDNSQKTIYNLSGLRLSQPQHGVNIVDGKKVVVK